MKNGSKILCFLLVVVLMLSACGSVSGESANPAPESSKEESSSQQAAESVKKTVKEVTQASSAETSAAPAETTQTPETTPGQTVPQTEAPTEAAPALNPEIPKLDCDENIYAWSARMKNYLPYTLTMPDSLHKAKGAEDVRKEGSYYIAALDLELTIPEGYYIYRVNGLYWHDYGKLHDEMSCRAEFADEYIFTNYELKERDLIFEIYSYLDPELDSHQAVLSNPPYVLWSFRVYHKDYLPIAKLFESRIQMTEEIRLKGDYVIEIGSTRWNDVPWDDYMVPHNSPEYQEVYQACKDENNTVFADKLREACREAYAYSLMIPKDEYPVDGWIQAVKEATEGNGLYYLSSFWWQGYYGDRWFDQPDNMADWSKYRQVTMLNLHWWNNFKAAEKELKENAEQYAYPENAALEYSDWYQDSTKDTVLRAYVWATLQQGDESISLSDISIVLHDTENACPLYLVYLMRENQKPELVMQGLDVTWLCDFDFAHEYAEEYLTVK